MSALAILSAVGQNADAEKLLKNKDSREQIFSCILNDHDMMTQFMEQAMGNNHAMQMMDNYYPMMHSRAGYQMKHGQAMMNQSTNGMNHMGRHMMDKAGSTNMYRGDQMTGTPGDSLNCGNGPMMHRDGMTGIMGMMNMMAEHHPEMMNRTMADMPEYCNERIKNCPFYNENEDLNQNKERK